MLGPCWLLACSDAGEASSRAAVAEAPPVAAADGAGPVDSKATRSDAATDAPARAPAADAADPTRSAASPGPTLDASTLPGVIHFVSERDGNLEVYRWRAGAALERLTDDPRADFVGAVAPDGGSWTRVATEDGAVPEEHREHLLWMQPGAEPVPLAPVGRRARAASWAPDHRFVVYESDADGAFSDLWRWDRDGTRTRLTETVQGSFEPDVSPDGQRIAFVSGRDGNPEIYVMDADGGDPRRLTTWRRDDVSPRWSPDGTRLAMLRREQGGERLFVLTLEEDGTTHELRLLPTTEGERVKHADHGWSPDGTRLVFTEHRPQQAPRVMVVPAAGGPSRAISPPSLRATMPQWSPDGRYVVFVGTVEDPDALDLYAVRVEDGAWSQITNDPAPDWLPRWTPSVPKGSPEAG